MIRIIIFLNGTVVF